MRAHISHDRDAMRGIVTPSQKHECKKKVGALQAGADLAILTTVVALTRHPNLVKLLAFRLDRVGEQEVLQLL